MTVHSALVQDAAKAYEAGDVRDTYHYALAMDVWTTECLGIAGLRMYTELKSEQDAITYYGPYGKIEVRPDLSLPDGTWKRRSGLDLGRLVSDIATMGTPYFRQQKRARTADDTQACGYCGAPGQRIGSRCEYCQVAVSR